MKRIFQFFLFLSLLPVPASGQKRFNEIGAVYGAIRSMTPEAYKEAYDEYGIRWIEAWTGNLTVVRRSSTMLGSNVSIRQ